jgi:rhodanese-related sulfurtransferase
MAKSLIWRRSAEIYGFILLHAAANPCCLNCLSLLKFRTMKEITVEELKQKIDNKEDFQLIDVRETFEYETSNLEGENIPLGGVLIEADKVATDKPVVIMCRSGKRSAAAVMQLEQLGLTNLYNLKGGILAWQDAFDPNMPVY